MKRIIAASFVLFGMVLTPLALAQEAPPVPVDKASYHVPAFRNDLIAVTNVYIPPGRQAGYHIHSLDQLSVVVEDADQAGQELGGQPYPARRTPRGNVGYTAFSKKAVTHRVHNQGTTPFHNIVTSILYPEPGRFTAGSRADVPAYKQVLDNDRVRIWRLVLEPGESAAAIIQKAPGLRIVVSGGEIVEAVPGQPEQAMSTKLGEFFWKDAGTTRAIRNIGTSKIEFVEYELK
jgi:hypothetical protein